MAFFNTMKGWMDKHYDAKAATKCNTCHVGAWVIGREQHFAEKSGDISMKTFFQRFTRNTSTVANAALAEDTETAERAERPQCKILVVCKGMEFSSGVIDYAINMAARTRSSLVALNLDEGGRGFERFRAEAQNNIGRFETKAKAAGLLFKHEVRRGSEDTVIDAMYREDDTFRYVMDDTAAVCRNRRVIPVYTRATLRAK